MGQKSNIQSLRKSNKNFNFLTQNVNHINFFLTFSNLFKRLFLLKGVLVSDLTLNFLNNQLFCNFFVYYTYSKVKFYKKRNFSINNFVSFYKSKNTKVKNIFSSVLSLLKTNLIVFKVTNLNINIDKKLLNTLYWKVRFVKNLLFARRHTLFVDFLGVTCLFFQGFIKAELFLKMLGEVFKILPKRRHNMFLSFLKRLFTAMIELDNSFSVLNSTKIKGFKFTLAGKIQGKLRGSTTTLQLGQVPVQSIDKNIEFCRLHVYTVYGAFGMKLWVYRNHQN